MFIAEYIRKNLIVLKVIYINKLNRWGMCHLSHLVVQGVSKIDHLHIERNQGFVFFITWT